MGDIAFLVLLALVLGALAVRQFVGADRVRRTKRLQHEHELAVANALWEVRRRVVGDKAYFYLWHYPDVIEEEPGWCVQLGQSDDVAFMEQHSKVRTEVEDEARRRNFELMEIRRAEQQDQRSLKY